MTTPRIYLKNLLANWFGYGATMAVMFFLSPFVLNCLGKVEYGIWSLLTVVTGYMGALDLGIRASTGRYVILYLGREDHDAVDSTIRTSLGFFSILGMVVVAVGLGLGVLFPKVFASVPGEYGDVARILLPLLALGVWLSALQAVFTAVLVAHERFDLARSLDLAVLAFRAVGTVGVLVLGFGLVGLAAVTLICSVLGLVGTYLLARRLYPALRLWPLVLNRVRMQELFAYGLAAFVSTVAVRLMGQTDLIIAGAAIGVDSVAVYSVGAMLVFYSDTFLSYIGETLFPPLQKAVARQQDGPTRSIFMRGVQLRLALGLLIYVGLIVFAEPFIHLWMYGPKFDESSVRGAALVMQILAASKILLLFKGDSALLLNATGRVRLTSAMIAAEAALNLILSLVFVLVFDWQLAGIAAATLVARLVVGTFIIPWRACVVIGVPWRTYLVRVGGLGLLVGSLFAGVCLAIHARDTAPTWPAFFLQVGVATAVYSVLAVGLLISTADRQRLSEWVGLRLRPEMGQGDS